MLEVVQAEYRDRYEIWLEFNDGVSGVVDLSDTLWGPVFEPLKDVNVFKQFTVSDTLHTLVWENGADLAPEYLREKLACHTAASAVSASRT